MRIKKFKIGQNGLNHLYGAYNAFNEDKKIIEGHRKNYPTRQSGIKEKEQVKKLNIATKKVQIFIKDLEKELVF